ncbi:MAG: 4Fe-4S binding protein [Candidatus Thorarchaeota archaeon]|nr:MAG: 4Fe-4S binding protein [Candidatus Thorarchaeota archaeon]
MARPLWFVQLLKKTFPNVRNIAKMTNVPLIGRIIDKMLFEDDNIIYLPKDSVVIKIDQNLETPPEMVLPSQIVDHFIDKANFHWIMDFCICRDSCDCQDYPKGIGCLFLGEAAKRINPHLGRQVTKSEAHEYVRKASDAGLVHLIGRNKLDAMWLDAFPGENLLTVCNCCPCCCLWRTIQDLHPDIAKKITKMHGVKVEVTEDCAGCGTCTEGVCFVNAIQLVDNLAVISDECRGCGRCVEICPNGAIRLSIDDVDYFEQSVKRVSSAVDVT